MAVKKVAKSKTLDSASAVDESVFVSDVSPVVDEKNGKKEKCSCKNCGRTAQTGWFFLLLGGLAHMLPAQMAPVLGWSYAGISLQMAVGAVSVVIALYYLLGE